MGGLLQMPLRSRSATVTALPGTVIVICALAALSACSAGGATDPVTGSAPERSPNGLDSGLFKNPALIAFDNSSGTLEYWTIRDGGSHKPIAITSSLRIDSASGMGADGMFLTIASTSPSELVTYNLHNQVEQVYPDPSGPPVDITLAKGDTAYVLDEANVVGYPLDRSAGRPFSCPYINEAVSIAADDQSDVFVSGYGPSYAGVVEFPTSSWTCTPLDLKPELGVIGGIGIDPTTNDLIVVDNPGSCSGSGDGRMTIYKPPYSPKTATQVNLNATYCAGTFRLDAASQNIFVMDANGSSAQIDELSYPDGQSEGTYSGGTPGAFVTLPNALPN
jgi:hypothetical protein